MRQLFTDTVFPCHMTGVAATFKWSRTLRELAELELPHKPATVWLEDENAMLFWELEQPVPVHTERYARALQVAIACDVLALCETCGGSQFRDLQIVPFDCPVKVSLETGKDKLKSAAILPTLIKAARGYKSLEYASELDLKIAIRHAVAYLSDHTHFIPAQEGLFFFEGDVAFVPWHHIVPKDVMLAHDRAYLERVCRGTACGPDGRIWRNVDGVWRSMTLAEYELDLLYTHGLSSVPDEQGRSDAGIILHHVMMHKWVDAVGEYLFRPNGIIDVGGRPHLNLGSKAPMQPAPPVQGCHEWTSAREQFPTIAKFLEDSLQDDGYCQLETMLHWIKSTYVGGIKLAPVRGSVMVLVAKAGDKTPWKLDSPLLGGLLGTDVLSIHTADALGGDTRFAKRTVANAARRGIETDNIASRELVLVFSDILPVDVRSKELNHPGTPMVHILYVKPADVDESRIDAELPFFGRFLLEYSPARVEAAVPDGVPICQHRNGTTGKKAADLDSAMPALEEFIRQYAVHHPEKLWWQGRITDLRQGIQLLCPDLLPHVFPDDKGIRVSRVLKQMERASLSVMRFEGERREYIWRVGFDTGKRPNNYFKRLDAANSRKAERQWAVDRHAGRLSDYEIFGTGSKKKKGLQDAQQSATIHEVS